MPGLYRCKFRNARRDKRLASCRTGPKVMPVGARGRRTRTALPSGTTRPSPVMTVSTSMKRRRMSGASGPPAQRHSDGREPASRNRRSDRGPIPGSRPWLSLLRGALLPYGASPICSVNRTRSAIVRTPIFSMIRLRCTLIVFSTVPRSQAICLFSRPEITCLSTSPSRGVN